MSRCGVAVAEADLSAVEPAEPPATYIRERFIVNFPLVPAYVSCQNHFPLCAANFENLKGHAISLDRKTKTKYAGNIRRKCIVIAYVHARETIAKSGTTIKATSKVQEF